MIAYKFRSEDQLAFALDIIFNQRLYCSDWSILNDPMEGLFGYSNDEDIDPKEQVEKIIAEKQHIRICSLSRTIDSHLLWAHYASGFSGLAIEVILPDTDNRIKNINYSDSYSHISINGKFDPNEAASTVLSNKYKDWEYEQEVRVLNTNNEQFFRLNEPVSKVIVGHRMKPALFQALRIICKQKNIPFSVIDIADATIIPQNIPHDRIDIID